jgi:methylamine dehydrogenase accessory protein MauD
METAWMISTVVLWCVVLALVAVVLALARQIGILYERVAPMGALMIDQGPQVGDAVPPLSMRDLDGAEFVPGAGGRGQLLFFLSPTCPVCKKLLPILRSLRSAEGEQVEIVLASDGEMPEHMAFRDRERLGDFRYVLSTELGMTFRIAKLPYAVLLDEQGRVRAKGLVNSREQLESLFAARELGVASIQEFVARRPQGAHA